MADFPVNSAAVGPKPQPSDITEDDRRLLRSIQTRFGVGTGPFYTTDQPETLWPLFLSCLPAHLRQTYTCNACRRFVERYGGLAAIDRQGNLASPLWDADAADPTVFGFAVSALAGAVARAKVTGVFFSSARVWGEPVTGPWEHFAVTNGRIYADRVMTADQAMAEKHEEYRMLQRALAEYSIGHVVTAVNLLKSGDTLYRAEKVLGVAEWLYDLHTRRALTNNTRLRDHITWRAVADAPTGFCHVRATMIGTLLDDLVAGKSFAQIKDAFERKMHPLQYQRPTVPPSAGNIQQAERLVESLGLTPALKRRYARLEEVEALWVPTPREYPNENHPAAGVFAHLKPKTWPKDAPGRVQVEAPAITLTWDKFQRTVLPTALSMECYTPNEPRPYIALVTAVDPSAPPLLQWDTPERRNPVSWYLHAPGSFPPMFHLPTESWAPVTAVCYLPPMWGRTAATWNSQWSIGAILLLKDARDVSGNPGTMFFPEMLRNELHGVRATLEAYASTAPVEEPDAASACGADLRKDSGGWGWRVRVTTALGRATYVLDRWD